MALAWEKVSCCPLFKQDEVYHSMKDDFLLPSVCHPGQMFEQVPVKLQHLYIQDYFGHAKSKTKRILLIVFSYSINLLLIHVYIPKII